MLRTNNERTTSVVRKSDSGSWVSLGIALGARRRIGACERVPNGVPDTADFD